MNETYEGFGWNDTVEVPENGFELLPVGPAVFQITKLERQRKEFGKFGVCNVAVLTFLCSPVDGNGTAEVQSQFALVKPLGWKIVKLATSCGFRQHGESNEIDPRWWGQFEGATGRCEIGHRTYTGKKDGKERKVNEITDFLPAAAEQSPSSSAGAHCGASTLRGEGRTAEEAGQATDYDNLPF